MGMNMRSLNTFAGGMARGIGAGQEVANRKQLMDLTVAADTRAGKESDQLVSWIEEWRERQRQLAAGGRPSVTTTPTPNQQSFAQQSAAAEPPPTFGPQPGQATTLQQPEPTPMLFQRPRPRSLIPFGDFVGFNN